MKSGERSSLDRSADVELEGRRRHAVYRRIGLGILGLIVVAALLNAFGQETTTSVAVGRRAVLSVEAPPQLRGGLLFQARFEVRARRRLAQPRLVLSPGWLESMTLNTVSPEPLSEGSGPGGLSLAYPPLAAGRTLVVRTEWQVNPTNVGRRGEDVALFDGPERVAGADRTLTVFP